MFFFEIFLRIHAYVAELSGQAEEYERSRNEFVRVANVMLMHNLTQFNSREYLLNACICQLLLSEEIEVDSYVCDSLIHFKVLFILNFVLKKFFTKTKYFSQYIN